MTKTLAVIVVLIATVPPVIDAAAADNDYPTIDKLKDDKAGARSVNPPTAAEPVKPRNADQPPEPVAPGTLDALPKPAAPGTLDKNIKNPDVENRKAGKPEPR